MLLMIHGYVISNALGIQFGGAKSDNIADIVTPSSLTIATMASIYGSDESISNFSVLYQTYPRTAMVDPAVIDVRANKYVDGSSPSTQLRLRLPRNATTQLKSLPDRQ